MSSELLFEYSVTLSRLGQHLESSQCHIKFFCHDLLSSSSSYLPTVRPDWAIYCTLGHFSKPAAKIILPKLPNFCNVVETFHFSSEIIFGNFYRHLAPFFWSHCLPIPCTDFDIKKAFLPKIFWTKKSGKK